MFKKQNVTIIWVSGRQLSIMSGAVTTPDNILFPSNVVSHLEVVDHDALYALVKEWTEKHPNPGSEIVWIFGPDVSFEHVMQESESKEWDSVVVKFLDLLPFEEVESRTYMNVNGTKVVAINKDMYNTLKRAFSLQGYTTLAEVVSSELGGLSKSQGLDSQVARYVMKNLDLIEKSRIQADSVDVSSITPPGQKRASKSSLPLLIGVFVALLVILGLVIWKTYS